MIDNVEGATGYRPNRVVFGGDSFRHASRNDKVIDKIRETGIAGGGNNATRADLAALFQVDQVLVGAAYKDNAEEAIADDIVRIWGNHTLVYYAPPNPSIEVPSYGYSLRWSAPGLPNMQVERHPYNRVKKCDELEIGLTLGPLSGNRQSKPRELRENLSIKLQIILSEAHKLWERATTILFRSTLQAIGSGSAGHPSGMMI